MILYHIRYSLNVYLIKLKEKPIRSLILVGALFLSLFYAYGIGNLLNISDQKLAFGITNISFVHVFRSVIALIFIIPLLRAVLPNYIPMKRYFQEYYPVSSFNRYLNSLLIDFANQFSLLNVVFIIGVTINLHNHRFVFFTIAINSLVSSLLLRRLVQYGIDFRLKRVGYILYFALLFISILPIIAYQYINILNQIIAIIYLIFLLISGYLLEITILENRHSIIKSSSYKMNIYSKLLYYNNNAKIKLVVAFTFKVFFFVFMLHPSINDPNSPMPMLILICGTPSVLMSYLFFNVWGHWPSVWLQFEVRSGNITNMIKFIGKLLLIPLFIDSIISITILWVSNYSPLFIIVYYFTSTVLLLGMSVFMSTFFSNLIKDAFQSTGSVSAVPIFVLMVLLVPLYFIRVNAWFYLLPILYILLAVSCFYFSIKNYHRTKMKIFSVLK